MKISFVAGFGPIVGGGGGGSGDGGGGSGDSGGESGDGGSDGDVSLRFWKDLGFPLAELAPAYFGTDDVDGVKAFALWPLSQAAESTFGVTEWPGDLPIPQAWLELDVESPDAVAAAVAELQAAGHRVLRGVHEEPWGQTTSRLLSPEGLLVGITFTPWMHKQARRAKAKGS